MMPVRLGYEFRYDGMYLVHMKCRHCEENYEVIAIQNTKPSDIYGLCDACDFVREREEEAMREKDRFTTLEPLEHDTLSLDAKILFWCFIGGGMWIGAYYLFVMFLAWMGR